MSFDELRQKYPEFVYESFETVPSDGGIKLRFHFSIGEIKLVTEVFLPGVSSIPENLALNLGMMESISYWKATCSPKFIIKAGYFSPDQIAWWKNLFIKGLGEFYFSNKIDFTKPDLIEFVIQAQPKEITLDEKIPDKENLIMIGGGKDSAVTLGIFENAGKEFGLFSLSPTQAARDMMNLTNKPQIILTRKLDPQMLELNRTGFLNGHTPISAVYAFYAFVAGILFGYKNIIVSNESSSNEGNVLYLGQEINHQFSKSYEMEKLLADYFREYLSKNVFYFSFLRPLNELQISKLFASLPKFHQIFRSCNKGSKENVWCGICAKCAFAYLMLYPFLGAKTAEIFGRNLLDDVSLLPVFESLGQIKSQTKPFECVGTKEEVVAAVLLSLANDKEENRTLKVLEALRGDVNSGNSNVELLKYWNDENSLPGGYVGLLKNSI